jgi:hypothetical protein
LFATAIVTSKKQIKTIKLRTRRHIDIESDYHFRYSVDMFRSWRGFHLLLVTLFWPFVAAVAACAGATFSDVIMAKRQNEGTAQIYSVPPDEAWNLARHVLRSEGMDSIKEHRTEGYMLTSTGYDGRSAGCYIGVWIEPVGERTKVTVITMRKDPLNLMTGLSEDTFQRDFAAAVSGKTR